jgi:hypothetical protein
VLCGGIGVIPEPDSRPGDGGVSSGDWGVWGLEGDADGPRSGSPNYRQRQKETAEEGIECVCT